MAGQPTLYGLSYSPWTERARWALKHHDIAYRYREHVPFLGEPLLRLLSRKTNNPRATVPLYRDGDLILGDSFAIVRHVDGVGAGAPLIRPDIEALALKWRDRIEAGMHLSRKRVVRNTLGDPEALREAAESSIPKPIAGFFRPVAAMGVRFFSRKYGFSLQDDGQELEAATALLEALREQLGDGPYMADEFSVIDIMAATYLQGISPVDGRFIPLKPATRKAWSHPALTLSFGDLIAWRDKLYEEHRR